MIVVDVGCHPHGNEESVYKLTRHYRPELLIGLDPYPLLQEGIEHFLHDDLPTAVTTIVRRRCAAWTTCEPLSFEIDGITSGLVEAAPEWEQRRVRFVWAVDLASLLLSLPQPVVLKLDCEGSEYPILENIHERGIDGLLDRVIVEWHPPETARGFYLAPEDRPHLRCPVEDWEDW